MRTRLIQILAVFAVLIAAASGFLVQDGHSNELPKDLGSILDTAGQICEEGGLCAPLPSTVHGSAKPSGNVETNALITRVVDGDTFEARLDGDDTVWKVRMLGINTPETVDPRRPVECYGKEASGHLKKLLDGKRVRLESDEQADERDKYDRLLRNVILEDGTDVNAAMVRDGFAYAYLSFPLNKSRKQELKMLQELARASSAGLWSEATCGASLTL